MRYINPRLTLTLITYFVSVFTVICFSAVTVMPSAEGSGWS